MEQRAPTSPPVPTRADYFAAELASPVKHEFRNGRIIAMAGAEDDHVLVAGNIHGSLWGRLRGSTCRVYSSDLRVVAPNRDSGYCYPDVTAVCGPNRFDPASEAAGLRTVINPRVIFEVLSPTTEADDRGDKFDGYREIPTLEQYVLVAQDHPYALTFTRQDGGGWLMLPYLGVDAVVPLASLGVELPMGEIYANVKFPPSATPAEA
jgi:Uma2 family endonuclease